MCIGELLEVIREAQAEGEVKTREDALEFARLVEYILAECGVDMVRDEDRF